MDIKGSNNRLIHPPGYHIKPKYDLIHIRRHLDAQEDRDLDVVLPLTSMIDMFSMLVIFLLLNFSATGEAFFVNKDIKLPKALNTRPIESLPLISITKQSVTLDSAIVGSHPTEVTLSPHMPKLVAALQHLKQLQGNLALAGLKPKTQINIQADQNTPILYVKRVMNILISEGFTGINFAVREDTSGL